MKFFRRLAAAVGLAGIVQAGPASADESRDCMALRKELGWSRAEYRECKLQEMRKETEQLNAEFERKRAWLQTRGLDLNDAGHIVDAKGRTLAVIEAQNAALAADNAELAAGNAALRASIAASEQQIKLLDEEYAKMMADFRVFLSESAE